MPPLYLLTAVDVRRAEQTATSRATTISKMVIPPIKLMTANHNPGGGVMSVDFSMPRTEPIEPAMEIKGFDIDIFRGYGVTDRWAFAAALRNKRTNADVPFRAVIEGAITEWEPDEASPEEFVGCNHVFKEVTHYEIVLDGKELWYIDFWERIMRRNGQDLFAGVRQALGA